MTDKSNVWPTPGQADGSLWKQQSSFRTLTFDSLQNWTWPTFSKQLELQTALQVCFSNYLQGHQMWMHGAIPDKCRQLVALKNKYNDICTRFADLQVWQPLIRMLAASLWVKMEESLQRAISEHRYTSRSEWTSISRSLSGKDLLVCLQRWCSSCGSQAGHHRLLEPCPKRQDSSYDVFHLQGSESAEVQAVKIAGPGAQGSTAYLNLETGDCHGDDVSLRALVQSGASRVVFGLNNPLRHCRGLATKVTPVVAYLLLRVQEFWTINRQALSKGCKCNRDELEPHWLLSDACSLNRSIAD